MTLLNLVYRDKLFPRSAYRRAFEVLIAHLPEKIAWTALPGLAIEGLACLRAARLTLTGNKLEMRCGVEHVGRDLGIRGRQ